jgi:hypothetical protein
LLPNPNSVHVNYNGYKLISDLVIEKLHFWQIQVNMVKL